MAVLRMGFDAVRIDRMEKKLKGEAFCRRAFSEEERYVDYEKLFERNQKLLYEIYQVENYCGLEKNYPDFSDFLRKNEFWLRD